MASRWQATGPCQSSVGLWVWRKKQEEKKKPSQDGWYQAICLPYNKVSFLRGWKTRSHSFFRSGPQSSQNITTVRIPPLSSKCYIGQCHHGSCIMMCFKMFQLVSGYCIVTLIFSHNLFIVTFSLPSLWVSVFLSSPHSVCLPPRVIFLCIVLHCVSWGVGQKLMLLNSPSRWMMTEAYIRTRLPGEEALKFTHM